MFDQHGDVRVAARLDEVGGLVVLALQTDLTVERTSTGGWRLRVHKAALSDSTIAGLLTKLVGLLRSSDG